MLLAALLFRGDIKGLIDYVKVVFKIGALKDFQVRDTIW